MASTLSVKGKRILITGASSGLGQHFARLLAGEGAHLILAARRLDRLQAFADTLDGEVAPVCIRFDVTDATSRQDLAARIDSLDVLINNAGIVRPGPAAEHTAEDWNAVMDTNLNGIFFLSQALLPALRQNSGSIVNIASILGLRQAGGVVSYAVSKAGVIQLSKTLALEWARYGVRVNTLAPGYIETEFNANFWPTQAGQALINRIPQRRLGQLTDLDGPILLLCSDASRYMTGSVLAVDGGHLVNTL
ncbi:SDR family NAD(P)-dependent oxidoreductase [Bordetella sp. 15P40C-2]|uniref:SDR family NAD(P)-dependent oxidoreductase n=1 Tax=Bordetella sp. 15P40C-2 TaxID=2572246 RepID=UPI00132C6E59|nr:SDR family oxidoreductase [Bordetella sp. 15P40C-2]MVW70280.1 SDR family oxidoreductase [Bordetella sp. 15P40C-2]